MQNQRLRFLTYFILGYMFLAFVWWSVLLYHKNRDAFQAKIELQHLGMRAEGLISSPMEFYLSDRYEQLKRDYRRQERMILGEAAILSISLMVGFFIVYTGYRREVKASQQQRNFLLSITHELKSPLAGIRLALETIAKRGDQLTPEKRTELSERGIREADRLNKLVEDLLLSARLENAYQFHTEPVDLYKLVKNIIDQQQRRHPKADIQLIAKEEPLQISGDTQALNSVVLNLVENAIKYSKGQPTIKVEMHKLNDEVHLSIADQGIGIPQNERQQVFEKFYRAGSEDTRTTKGTGLGLFIVKELVKAHNGKVSIGDNTPKGSVFTVRLPILTTDFAPEAAQI